MIHYNTENMHTVAKTIQSNGQKLQGDLQNLWSFYQMDMDMHGAFPAFTSHLTAFMTLSKGASLSLAQNRIDIGTKLDQAATAAEQTDANLRTRFGGHPAS